MKIVLTLLTLVCLATSCLHDQMASKVTRVFLDDTPYRNGRLLQTTNSSLNIGNLRIFADYSLLDSTSISTVNLIKRMVNITSIYFYNILTVERLQSLSYPKTINPNCAGIKVPDKYVNGVVEDVDLGIIVGNEKNNSKAIYIAKSTSCAYLKSNKRPIWGVMVWNDLMLKYDPEGFQEMLYISAHQLTHVLGFSALLYDLFVGGSPLVQTGNGDYLNNTRLNRQVAAHFGCEKNKGMLLEDNDGTLYSSHWDRKAAGTEYMTATNAKSPFMSRFTLALLESTGWYPSVNYDYAEPNLWGKGKGCGLLQVENCESIPEYCTKKNEFACDFDGTGIGACKPDTFSNCPFNKYYTNTMCIDPNFETKNMNKKMLANEYGGFDSRCFPSNFRRAGLSATTLNFRCYKMTCSEDKKKIYVRILNSVVVCRRPNEVIQAPKGLTGTLTCPSNFEYYCGAKKTCESHCNINGICINGECLCTGNRELQPTCLNVKLTVEQVGSTGGFLNALNNDAGTLSGSKDNQCFPGYVLQEEYGECMSCGDYYNCRACTESGCLFCDDGTQPNPRGKCTKN